MRKHLWKMCVCSLHRTYQTLCISILSVFWLMQVTLLPCSCGHCGHCGHCGIVDIAPVFVCWVQWVVAFACAGRTACVMFVSPPMPLSFCVWCDRTKQFFPFVCECDYCRSRLLDTGTASCCKVCDLHRTSCLVACRVVCSATGGARWWLKDCRGPVLPLFFFTVKR